MDHQLRGQKLGAVDDLSLIHISTDEFLKDCERIIEAYHDPAPFSMRQVVIAPCQPMNSYKETFVESVKLARDKGVHLHTHLGEGENEIMVERYGKRTLDWCREIGFVGPDVWIAHGWELQPDCLLYTSLCDQGFQNLTAVAGIANEGRTFIFTNEFDLIGIFFHEKGRDGKPQSLAERVDADQVGGGFSGFNLADGAGRHAA